MGPLYSQRISATLAEVISSYKIKVLSCANDTHCPLAEVIIQVKEKMQSPDCIAAVKGWLSTNKLKLNDRKTEVVCVTSRFTPTELIDSITIGESAISPSANAGNLGVI